MTAAALLLGMALVAPGGADPAPPHGVGVIFAVNAWHPRAKRCANYVEIWYPSKERRTLPNDPETDYCRDAVRDAVPVSGKFPVVLFSHGLGGFRAQSVFLCEHLAKRGYIVVAPDHRGSCAYDLAPLDLWESVRRRTYDLQAALTMI